MNITSAVRSQFGLALCTSNSLTEKCLKTYLGLNGYQLQSYLSESEFLHDDKRIGSYHIVIIDLKNITKLSNFIEAALKANAEILFVAIGPASLAHKVEKYYSHGLRALINPEAGIEAQTMMILDNLVSELYYRFQNEQLLQVVQKKEKQLSEELESNAKNIEYINHTLTQKIAEFNDEHEKLQFELKKQKELAEHMVWLNRSEPEFLERAMANEQKDPIASFFIHLERSMDPHVIKGFYFRYMPQVEAFLLTQHSNMSGSESINLRNLRYRPAEVSATILIDNLEQSIVSEELIEFIEVGLGMTKMLVLPLSYGHNREGFFIFDQTELPTHSVILRKIKNEYRVFKGLYFQRKLTQLWTAETKGIDKVTQLETKDAYYEKLSSEFSRALRLNHPMSLIKVAIDHKEEITGIYSDEAIMSSLQAQIARLIKVTSRINDLTFKTGDNEFSIILPHTSAKGAAVRAERLRRLVESHIFNHYRPGYVTISLGIAEYPTLAVTVDTLEQAAYRALNFIQKRASNKVCLFTLESSR